MKTIRTPSRHLVLGRLAIGLALATLAGAARPQEGATTRVSVMTGCGKAAIGLGHSREPAISDDGRFIVFSSDATTLVQGNATIAWFANLDGAGGFGPLQLITTNLDEPTSIGAAMLDGDALLDLVTASFMDDRIAWYANGLPTDGTFDGPLDISTAMDATSAVATGDMDGDGDVDVLATAPEAEKTVWFPNDGQGGFGAPVDIFPYGRNRSVFPADVDGDGDLDALYTVDFSTGEIAWQENRDGAGSFSPEHGITTLADGPWAVHAADFDGDGDLDVVSASVSAPSGPRIQWYANLDGQGAFGAPALVSTAADPSGVGAGDLDGDGDMDLLAALSGDRQVVWHENLDGVGNFGPAIVLAGGVATPSSIAAEDLDGDGDDDVLVTSNGLGEVAWFRNTDGFGTFSAKIVIGASVPQAQQARAADIDADGDADVLVAAAGSDEICWFQNTDGLGSFSAKLVITSLAQHARSVHAVDIDADGGLDVVSASRNDDRIAWYRNLDGLGSFGPQQTISLAADGATSVFGVDLDGDGDGDVASWAEVEAQLTWYENTDGLGTAFVTRDLLSPGEAPKGRTVLAADIDGDSDPDLLTAGGWLGDVSWFENPDGQAGFGQKHSIMTSTKSPRCVAGADLDGDGDIDALSASFNDDKLAWSRNLDGLGTFGPQLAISTTVDGARWVTAGDLDGDGDLDVLVAGELEHRVSWFENLDGAGGFGAEHTVTAAAPDVRQASLADVDGDLDLDVLVPSFGNDMTTWHENDGSGLSFTPHVVYDGPTVGATAVEAADVDADGDLDLLLASASPGPDGLEVYRHDRYLLETTWVSQTLDGTVSNGVDPAVSADGRYVAFESVSQQLVPGPDVNPVDVYLRDVQSGTTERIDVSSAGVQANNTSLAASLSGDGRYVAFESFADNLVVGDTTCCSSTDVFLRDRLTGTTIRVNERPDATPPDGATQPALSSDGQYVAFVSADAALVAGDTNAETDVFVRNIATGVIARVSLASGGVEIVGGNCQEPALSADARFVAFRTHADLDPADDNGLQDVYVHDRQSLATTWASVTSTGGAANDPCEHPQLSADGRSVSFVSRATDLVPGTTVPNVLRAYRRDLQTGTTELMSIASDGTQSNASIVDLDLSGDGMLVAFDTLADNLVASDTDDVSDVFVHGIDPWFPLGCDEPGVGGAPLLKGSGPLASGSAGKLGLSNAKPSSLAMLFVSLVSTPVAFKGGVLVAFPPTLQLPFFVGPSGSLNLNFTWPGGVPHGVKVYFHYAIADAGAEFGVALSSAIRGVTP